MLLHFPGFSNLTWIVLVQIANGSLFQVRGSGRRAPALMAGRGSTATRRNSRPSRGWISPFTGAPSRPGAGCAQCFPGW